MSWINFAWPMMGGVSLTLGLIHLLIWFRQRSDRARLIFGLAAMSVASMSIIELQMIRAVTPEQYAAAVRLLHLPLALLCLLLVLFVHARFDAGRRWLGVCAYILPLLGVLPNYLSGASIYFRDVTAIERVGIWGGATVAVPYGDPNPWMLLTQASDILLVAFMIDAALSVRRRGNAYERHWATIICGSIALFVAEASIWGGLVVMGWMPAFYSINIAFIVVIAVMGYELGGDVIQTTQLAHRLDESEENLRKSRQSLQLAAQAAELGLWSWALHSDELWLTRAGSAMLGLPPGERIGSARFLERVHPEDRQAVLQAREDAVHRTGEYVCQFRLPLADGGVRWIAAKGRVEPASSGQPDVMRGVVLDVTERRLAGERFRLMLESAPAAMLMVDADGDIVLSNARAQRMFGYTRSELLAKSLQDLVRERQRAGHGRRRVNPVAMSRAGTLGSHGQLLGHRMDGSEIPVEVMLNPVNMSEGRFVLASITDINERLQVEQEVALQRAELAHLSRMSALGEMSGSLAHELNQPLTAVLSNAQAALRFMDRDQPDLGEVRESLVRIIESDKRAGEIIRGLRAMLRKEQAEHQALSINDVVQDVVRLANNDLLNRGVSLLLDLGQELPAIHGDRVQLQQVLLNLVINGCDAMSGTADAGQLTIRTGLASDDSVQVTVSDIGPGIPPDDLERIFSPFVTGKKNGMGLGLSVCRTIIQSHQGTLWANNNHPHGAVLHFVLPATTASPKSG